MQTMSHTKLLAVFLYRKFTLKSTSSTQFLMYRWKTLTGINSFLFSLETLSISSVLSVENIYLLHISSTGIFSSYLQFKERRLWDWNPEPATVIFWRCCSFTECYTLRYYTTCNNPCVCAVRLRCWTTVKTHVKTHSSQTLREKPLWCSSKWSRRRTQTPGLNWQR